MSRKEIVGAVKDDGFGFGGGPHTYTGYYSISGCIAVDGPADVIGRDLIVKLTEEQVLELLGMMRSHMRRVPSGVRLP